MAVWQAVHLPVTARQDVLLARTSLFTAKRRRDGDGSCGRHTDRFFCFSVISLRGIPARREEIKGMDACDSTWGCWWKLNLALIWDESQSSSEFQLKWEKRMCHPYWNATKNTWNSFNFRNVTYFALRSSLNKLYDRVRCRCPERAAKHQILLQCNYPKIKILWAGRWTNLYS